MVMKLSASEVSALSRLHDQGEALDAAQRQAWLQALPAAQRHLAPLLRDMFDQAAPTTSPDGASPWPKLPGLTGLLGPALGATALPDNADQPGTLVGPYRLIRQIGDGGMASVWLAEQADGHIDRRVALKLPRQAGNGRGLAERMARERRIGARLAHPHIARLYDAGLDASQRPYIALEFIDGLPIDQWCRDQHCDAQAALRLFVPVIRAVAYAHRQQVVHRDLKPANILVDANGQAYLLDFGIATLQGEVSPNTPNLTREYGLAMTRRYASPEQIAGQAVGPASDIYSLGVTLYELLTGSPPHAPWQAPELALDPAAMPGDIQTASRRVTDPQRRRMLRGDVDAILWKALQPLPPARYASADAMADDIDRHLQGLPIQARRPPWHERLRRRLRRQRSAVLAGSVVAIAVAGTAFSQWQQAQRDADAAAQSQTRSQTVNAFIEGLFRLQVMPSPTASPMPPDAARDGSHDAPSAASANTSPNRSANTLQNTLPNTPQDALAPVSRLVEARFADQPAIQAELFGALARAYIDIGVGRQAAQAAGRQLALLRAADAAPAQLAPALLLLASANTARGRFQDAEQQAREAVRALPDASSDSGLAARAVLAGLLLPNGRTDEARAILQAVQAARPVAQRPPSQALARFIDTEGALLEIDNRFDAALAHWQRAIVVATEVEGPHSATAARIRVRMAMEELGRNRADDARRNIDLAMQALRNSGDTGPVQAAIAATRFAPMAFSMGLLPYEDARQMLDDAQRTVALWQAVLPPEVAARVAVGRGVLALRHQDLDTAAQLLEAAVPVLRANTDGLIDRRWLASYLGSLAMTQGHHDQAALLLQERLDLRVRAGNGATPFAAYDWVQLSHNALMGGQIDLAARILQQAPDFKPLHGDNHASGQVYAHAIAEQRVRVALARGDTSAALAAMPAPYGLAPEEDRSEPTLGPYALRGELLCAAGQPAQGLPYLQRSLAAMTPVLSPTAPALARWWAVTGLCALALGDRATARQFAQQARRALDAQTAVSGWYRQPLTRLEAALPTGRAKGDKPSVVKAKRDPQSGA